MEKKQMSIKVSAEVHEWMKQEAERRGLTLSQLGNIACTEYMEAKKAFDSIGGIDTIAKFLKAKAEGDK